MGTGGPTTAGAVGACAGGGGIGALTERVTPVTDTIGFDGPDGAEGVEAGFEIGFVETTDDTPTERVAEAPEPDIAADTVLGLYEIGAPCSEEVT